MDCSADLSRFVSWMRDHGLVVWDSTGAHEIARIPVGRDGINALALSSNGRRLAVGTGSNYVQIWNVDDLSRHETVYVGRAFISYVGFCGVDGMLVTESSGDPATGSLVEVWDAGSGARRLSFPVTGSPFSVAPNGQFAATATARGTIQTWSLHNGASGPRIRGNLAPVLALAFSLDSRSIATATADNLLKVWDIKDDGGSQSLSPSELGSEVNSSVVERPPHSPSANSQDGSTVVTCGLEPRIFTQCTSGKSSPTGGDARFVCSGDAIYLRERAPAVSPSLAGVDSGDLRGIACADFSPDGTQILTGTRSGIVTIWDAGTGEFLLRLIGHSAAITSASYSPDGSRIVTSSVDGTVRLWDSQTGRQTYSFDLPNGHAERVALFSGDGKSLILARMDPSDPSGTVIYSTLSKPRATLAEEARNAIRSYNERHTAWTL